MESNFNYHAVSLIGRFAMRLKNLYSHFRSALIVLFFVICSANVWGQSDGDYQTSDAGGNWNDISNWQVYAAGAWVDSGEYPGQSAGTGEVTILSGSSITLNVNPANPIASLDVEGSLNFSSRNLTISGHTLVSGSVSDNNNSGTINLEGGLTITPGGNYNIEQSTLVVTGPTTVQGTLRDSNNSGSVIFKGLLLVESGGSYEPTSTSAVIFQGGITNNGTFNKTGTGNVTFSGNNQSIEGNPLILKIKDFYIEDDITITVNADATFDLAEDNFYNNSNAPNALIANNGKFLFSRTSNAYINEGSGTGIISFHDLEIAGTGTKYVRRPILVSNNLLVNTGTILNIYTGSIEVSGTTTINGSMSDSNNAGTNTFVGAFLVNVGGSYSTNNTSIHEFRGGIQNFGTIQIYNAAAIVNFASNNQAIEGDAPVTLDGTITINDGITLTNKLTDTSDGLILEGTINGGSGTSTFVNEQLLSVRGANGPMLTTGSFDVATVGNIVRYDRNNVQDITPGDYFDLIVVGSNYQNKYLTDNTTVYNSFTIDTYGDFFPGQYDFSVAGNTIIRGRIYDGDTQGVSTFQNVDLSNGRLSGISSGNYLINGNLTMPTAYGRIEQCNLTVTGTTDIAVGSNLTLNNANGTKIFIGAISCDGDWLNIGNESIEIQNGLEFNGSTFTAGSGTYSFTTNDQSFTTTSAVEFGGGITIGDGITFTNSNSDVNTGTTINGVIAGISATSVFENRGIVTYKSGTEPMAISVLNCSNVPNTFNYNRDNNQTIKATTYGTLQITNKGTKTFQGNVEVKTAFETSEESSSIVTVNCNSYDLTLGGTHNLAATGTFTTGSNNIIYNGLGNQDLMTIDYGGNIVAAGSDIKSMIADLTVAGNITINNGSTFSISDNQTMQLADASVITNNGKLQVVGTSGNEATITGSGTGGYLINQTSATGEFHALHSVFDKTGGITISDGTIDNTNNFSHTTFSNGTGTEYLNIDGLNNIGGLASVQLVVFERTAAVPLYNITRTTGTGTANFIAATGNFSGENYDNDDANPGSLIEWLDPSSIYYSTGSVSAGLTASWAHNQDGSGGSPSLAELTDGSLTLIVQDGHTVTLDSNGDIDVKKLIVGEGTSGVFNIGSDATQQTLTVQELVEVKVGATLQPGSSGASAHILKLYGNMVNDGTINLRQSFTTLVNTEIYGVMVFSGANTPVFSELSFKTGCDATADVALDINWNLKLESGATFNDGGYTHKVEYNWTNNGGTYNATGGLEFDGGTPSITSGATTTFNHVTFNGGGLATIKQAIIMNGDLLVTNNSRVSVDDIAITVNGNYTVDAGSEYTQATNYTYFNGTDAQTITLNGTANFNRIYFTNGGVSAKTVVGDLLVNDWLMINQGATVEGSGSHSIRSGLRVDGVCNFSGEITMRGGTIDTNSASVNAFEIGTAKLVLTGSVNLRHSVGGQSVAITVNNDIQVTESGHLVINDDATLVGTGATLTLEAGRNLYIRGADNFPNGFGTYDFDPTANVVYDASIDQTIRGGFTYGRIYCRYANRKTVDGPLEIKGHLYLRDGATLDLANYSHTFSGSTIYNGTGHAGSIDGANATFTIGGADYNQSIEPTGTGIYTFGNLVLTQNAATATRTQTFELGSNINVTGDFTINNIGGTEAIKHIINLNGNAIGGPGGTFSLGAYCQLNVDHLNFGADVIDSFTSTAFDINSTVYYTLDGGVPGSSSNPIDPLKNQNVADGVTYGNLWFYRGNKVAEGNLDINGEIYRTSNAVFVDGGFTHNIAGNWKLNASNAYDQTSATGTIIFDGADQDINGVNFNNVIIGNSGNANLFNTLNIYGNITVNNGSSFNASTLGMNIGGDITVLGAGLYTQTTGRTTLNGDANQNITLSTGSNFGYLTINKANPASQTVTALTDVEIFEDLELTNLNGILDITNQTLYVGDDITIGYNSGVQNFITTGSTVVLNGSSAQYFTSRHEDDLVFSNLQFEGSGDKTLQYSDPGSGLLASQDFVINGDFTINGSLVDGRYVTLYVRGDWTNTGTFSHNRTVYFDGADQDISSSSFYHVSFLGTDTKTLTGNISVTYDLYIDGTATLNAAGNDITVGRHWYNDVTDASYVHGNGKVIFNAAHGAYIYSGTTTGTLAGKTFYALDINKNNSGYITLRGDLIVDQDFNVNSNTFNTSTYDVWVGGNFDVSGTYNCNNNESLLTLNASTGTYNYNPNGASFRGLVIDAPGATYEMQSDFTLDNDDMNLTAGRLNVNENQIRLLDGNRKININGGTLNVGEGSNIVFTNTQSIDLNSGDLYLVGAEGNTANLKNEHSNNHFSINGIGGTLHASNYRIQNGKINITGASLDATNNLSGGTFVEGDAGTSYITLSGVDLGAGISLTNMTFNAGADHNISRTSGMGVVSVTDAHGSMAGEYYEEDDGIPGTLIDWTFPAGFFWDGEDLTDNTDWHTALNWSTNTVPGVDDIVYLDHSQLADPYAVRTNGDASCLRINMDIQGGNAINLIVDSSNALDIAEHVVVGVGASLTQADNTALINVGKSWTNQGTYVHNNSKVVFDAASGDHIISTGGTGIGKAFYDIEINAGTSVYTLDFPLDIDNDLKITSGTLDLASASNDVTIAGDWFIDQANGGSFVANNGDVTFDGTTQLLTNGIFYNLIINSGTTTLNSNIAVEADITINSGATFDAQDRNIYVRDDWFNNDGTFAQSGLGTVIFDASSGVTQVVDAGTSSTVFNNLTFSNGAGKELGRDVSVNGNVLINDASGQVNLRTYTLTGVGSENKLTCNEVLRVEGANNFPTGFETLDFLNTSTVRYYADIDQEIYPATYGHLSLQRLTDGLVLPVKTAGGDIQITGTLYLNSTNRPVEMNMATNNAYVTLIGNIDLRGTSVLNWGTDDATLEHIGGGWSIDADIPTFNHLILSGTGDKYNRGNLDITGDLIIKSGVDLIMYNSSRDDFTNITGTPTGTISMETGARILNTRPSTEGAAIPENFGTYDFNANSTYVLYSNGIDQTVYTGSDIAYGNLTFSTTMDVTGDGVANLDIDGDFNTNTATYYDGGTDIEVAGTDIYFNRYVASSVDRKFILDGLRDQNLREDDDNHLDLASIEFRGTGVKNITDAALITGNWLIDAGVTARTGSNITFSGSTWTNNGYYQQTGNALTFNGTVDQTIDPGLADADNYFRSLIFDGATTKTFINNGADINNDITINDGTVDLGSLIHHLADELYNTAGGTLLSTNASLILDGAEQYIQSPNFEIYNITCSGSNRKRLCSDWRIGNDLTIESGVILDSRSTISSVTTDYDIYIGGDWLNEGTFENRSKKVTFNGNLSPTNITAGSSNFYDVEFAPTAAVNFTLLSPSTSISNQMDVGVNANINLNSTQLYLGRNTSALTHTVNGTLNVNEGAFLYFNNDGSPAILDVYGTLNIVGTSTTYVATLSSTTTSNRNKTQVNIQNGGVMAARYYLIEYISDSGLNLMQGSTLHATNNFSDGTFLGMRDQAGAHYLVLESNYAGGPISNVSFSYSGVPTQGRHYSVERKLAATEITFENVTGSVGSYRYENDEEATPAYDSGLLRWPEITETTWTGAANIDWHNDANWDNGVPTATIDAIIPDRDIDPIIYADAECKSLIISTGVLRLEDDKNLVVHSDVYIDSGVLFVNTAGSTINVGGDWTINTHGNFDHGNGSIIFDSSNGSVNILPRSSSFYNITFDNAITVFNLSGSTIGIDGGLTILNGVVSPSTNNYTINLYGDYIVGAGDFDASTNGDIVLKADGEQTVTDGLFNNLVVEGSGDKRFVGDNIVNGTTDVYSTLLAQSGSSITLKGDVTIDALGTFNDGGETHTFSGSHWYGDGTYAGAGTITFNRTNSDQYLHAATFNNLEIDCNSEILYLEDGVTINGDLTFKSGIQYVNLRTNTFTSNGSGRFSVESGVGIYLYGANNFPKAFVSCDLDVTSITRYYGSSDQSVEGVSYGNLYFDHANTKTLSGDTEVKGNLIFNESTLDVTTNNYSLTVGGSWTNNNAAGGEFICREGEVIFNNTSTRNISIGDGNPNQFYNLTVAASAIVNAANATNNDFIIKNNLNVTSGTFSAYSRTIYVGGDLLATGTGSFANSGLFYLNKAGGSALFGVNGSIINSVTINSGATYTVQSDADLRGSFTLISGTFDGNGHKLDLGNYTTDVVRIDGTYKVGPGGVLGLGNGTTCTVTSTGRIEVVGSNAGVAKVSNNTSGGRYTFVVEGEIAAEYYMFEFMSSTGIYLTSSSTIDVTSHFSNGTFSNGASSGQLFRIENTQSFTEAGSNRVENVSFPINPGGSASNVAKYEAGSGGIEFYNSVGVFAGESFDNDPSDLINWTGPVHLTWNGSVDSDWNNISNWTASSGMPMVPTSANNVYIAGGLVNYPVLTIDGQETGNLTIETGAEIRINTTATDTGVDLNVDGDFIIEGSISTSSEEDLITVEGNWTAASGAVLLLNGNVTFDGIGGAKQIDARGSDFYSLTISGSTQYQIARNTVVKNDLIINSGATLDANPSDYTITVNGDWINNGLFLAQQGTVDLLSTSSPRTIHGGSSDFYNLRINASGVTYNLNSDLAVDETLQLLNGVLDVKTNTLKVGDGSGTDGISISGSLLVNAGATLDMGSGASLNLNSGGSMELLGTDVSNRAVLTSSSGGRYSFDVNSGASIKAQYYSVDYIDADGLYMHPGANINAINNLSDGVFSNGASGGSYMTLLHDMSTEDFTLRNLVFNAGPANSVTRTSGWTRFLFEDATGELGNYLYERDEEAIPSPSSGLLRWPFVKLYTWEGDVDNNWLSPGNWFDDQLPVSTSDITIPNTSNNPIIGNNVSVEVHDIAIQTGAFLTIQNGARVTIEGDLTTADGLIIENSASSPASVIVNGTISGSTSVKWALPELRYWYMGHSVANVSVADYDASILPGGNDYFLYKYLGGWVDLSKSILELNDPLEGYSVMVKDANTVLEYSGVLNNGASYSHNIDQSTDNLIGNPYSSYIDVDVVGGIDFGGGQRSIWTRTELGSGERGLAYYNVAGQTGLNGGTNQIAPGQSFWVDGFGATNLVLNANTRVHGIGALKSTGVKPNVIKIALKTEYTRDETAIVFKDFGTTELTNTDTKKRMNSGKTANIYSVKENGIAAISILPEVQGEERIPLAYHIEDLEGLSEFTLSFTGVSSSCEGYDIYLVDNVLGVTIDLNEESSYSFVPKTEVNTEDDRFEILIAPQGATNTLDENQGNIESNVRVYAANGKCYVNIDERLLTAANKGLVMLFDITGKKIREFSTTDTITEFDLPSINEIFVVKVVVGNYSYQNKIISAN